MDYYVSLLNKISAGLAAIEESEVESLVSAIKEEFRKIPESDIFNQTSGIESVFSEIFEALLKVKLMYSIMAEISGDIYYRFGEYLLQQNSSGNTAIIKLMHSYLDAFRFTVFLQKIYGQRQWDELVAEIIEKSNYNYNVLFESRVKSYPGKTLFKVLRREKEKDISFLETKRRADHYQASIYRLFDALGSETEKSVSFLLENSLDMAILDIACLKGGIMNIMIPSNSVSQHVEIILNETKSPILFVHDEKQLIKIKNIKNNLPYLKKVIILIGTSAEDWVLSFREFQIKLSETDAVINHHYRNPSVFDKASVMYTSGTTGEPKGIVFSYLNIVYKRFCRAMAIPQIGETDKFICFLPLFHTFGRYLELTGCVFWAAEYIFMENPSVETMVSNMQNTKPTVLISIPKKWLQLYESISNRVDIESDSDIKIRDTISELTGGHLKIGLSAAGYLPPEVFEFFRRFGICLMSGFGMTEATGGITMTPVEKYVPNSLGKALPGIDIKIAEDGELLIKGKYVMIGYFGYTYEETFTPDGWFPTGDVMVEDSHGFIEIVDRKKDIYKNIKGETIAPQKIENLFQDFGTVKQVFLVGDHRPYNTVLVFPDKANPIIASMDEQTMRDYFASVVVTVNQFLAPFERILNFRIIDLPFTIERGELTNKGTFKRRVIEANYNYVIESMYESHYISLPVDGVEVRIPNWFLREIGCLSRDIIAGEKSIEIPKLMKSLKIACIDKSNYLYQVGNFAYIILLDYIDLQPFLINPIYWIGNLDLFEFTGHSIIQWHRSNEREKKFKFSYPADKVEATEHHRAIMKNLIIKEEKSLYGLSIAAAMLQSEDENMAIGGITYLSMLNKDESLPISRQTKVILRRPNLVKSLRIKRELFKVAISNTYGMELKNLIELYNRSSSDILDEAIMEVIIKLNNSTENYIAIQAVIKNEVNKWKDKRDISETSLPQLFKLLANFGISYPAKYDQIRLFLVRFQVDNEWQALTQLAREAREDLRTGFRKWLGKNQTIAVDIETGEEYEWKDVIIMEENVPEKDRERLIKAISETSLLREAVFIFYNGSIIRLNNILPGGVWISLIETEKHRNVYRVTIHTRLQGSFEIILNLNQNLDISLVKEEINWLILSGSRHYVEELIEDFGGYWDEYDIWSQKYLPRVTVAQYIRREIKKGEDQVTRLVNFMPFFVWNAAAAYINFWKLSGMRYTIKDVTPENIIIPNHDYQTGTRFVSFLNIEEKKSLGEIFRNFYETFVLRICEELDSFKDTDPWPFIFSGVINALGEKQGVFILKKYLDEFSGKDDQAVKQKLIDFIESTDEYGFVPKQLYFAVRRFHRWYGLNKEASLNAQAKMLSDLYETYNLQKLEESYPETRTRFFILTVFEDSSDSLKKVLNDIIKKQRNEEKSITAILSSLSHIISEFDLSERESFFLLRLSYPHLKPTDSAVLLSSKTEGIQTANLSISFEDSDGVPFKVRKPISPKEISKLHQIFIETNLMVNFRPEHEFLIAVSERGFIIGGLFYQVIDETTVNIEKIVVAMRYRRKGISVKLMNEFFSRMTDQKFEYVTTGFFRPEYFYRFGFKIEKKYSGLVKKLTTEIRKKV